MQVRSSEAPVLQSIPIYNKINRRKNNKKATNNHRKVINQYELLFQTGSLTDIDIPIETKVVNMKSS
jgi:hypothetical protein